MVILYLPIPVLFGNHPILASRKILLSAQRVFTVAVVNFESTISQTMPPDSSALQVSSSPPLIDVAALSRNSGGWLLSLNRSSPNTGGWVSSRFGLLTLRICSHSITFLRYRIKNLALIRRVNSRTDGTGTDWEGCGGPSNGTLDDSTMMYEECRICILGYFVVLSRSPLLLI